MTHAWTGDWRLMLGTNVLGDLAYRSTDQPWFHFDFTAMDHFDSVSGMFETELKLLSDDEMDAWEDAYDKIAELGLRLVSDSREVDVESLVLHIEGSTAWLRH